MKFKVSSSTLLNRLQLIGRVIGSKSTLPILDCFLLELKGNVLRVVAADFEMRLETWLEVSDVEGEGKLAINANNLLNPLRELPDQPITFDINDETLEVFLYYRNGKYNFVGLKGDEYPEPKPLVQESTMNLTLSAETLLSGINRTVFATADDELRPVMNGILFDITPDDITFVASDGHKLVKVVNKEVKSSGNSSFILPKKPANLLKTILPKESGDVEVSFDANNAYLTMGSYIMVCRFIEGRYPNYNSVIPKDNPNKITIDRLSLLNALKRVSVFSNPAIGLIKFQLSDNKIIITTQDVDYMTSAEETLECEYSGNIMNIGFKSSFIIDILDNLSSPDVVIELSDPSRAGLILPSENEENEDVLTLLMPMMLND
ncbi:MAG: DNA polymerase III subunit beta [Fermentimonas sp.]|jgi:DNA polymerase-3 subunit beta